MVQFENGAFASTPIPTTTIAVTRNIDQLAYTTASFLNPNAGTFSINYVSPTASSLIEDVIGINDGTTNERYLFRSDSTYFVTDGGVAQVQIKLGSYTDGTAARAAFCYATDDFAGSLNGAAVVTDTSGTLPTVTTINVGYQIGGNSLFGTISGARYWSSRLSNGQLQALTA
jgi:hypothetical protein